MLIVGSAHLRVVLDEYVTHCNTHTLRSGALGDYITWLAAGVAVLAAVWAVTFT